METISRPMLTFLLNAAWQIPVAAAVAAVVCRLLRKGPASHRHTVWVAALAAAILLPVASIRRPATEDLLSFPTSLATTPSAGAPADAHANSPRPTPSPALPPRSISIAATASSVLLAAYFAFLIWRLFRLLRASLHTIRVRRSARAAEIPSQLDQVRSRCEDAFALERVELLFSPEVSGPVTAGGAIILPEMLREENSEDVLTTAVGHEMAHIARRDFACNFVYEVLLLPIGFHPAAWLIRRWIERTREMACDEMVTNRLIDARTYARSIVSIATAMTALPQPGYTLGVFDGGMLEERIRRLVERPAANLKRARLLLAGGLTAVALCAIAASTLSFSAHAQGAASDLLKQGQTAYNRGDYQGAAVALDGAVRLDPNNLEARVVLGNSLARQVEAGSEQSATLAAAAREHFLAVLARDERNKRALHGMMTLTLYAKQFSEAQKWTQKAIAADSTDAEAYYTAGFIAWCVTYPDYMTARQAAGMQPYDSGIIPDSTIRQGVRTQHLAQIEDGLRMLQTALQINPDYSDAMAYVNLLYRIEAGIANSAAESSALVAKADDYVRQALDAKRKQARSTPPTSSTNPADQPLAPPPPPPPPPPPRNGAMGGVGGSSRVVGAQASGTEQPVRVEGNVQQGRLVKQVPPVYPESARQAGIAGTVTLDVLVGKDGTVQQINVLSGPPQLVAAAMQAVRQWVYRPATENGSPVSVAAVVNVTFAQ